LSKSIVAVYCGGRGSGKTLSMTAEGCLAMIAGKNVWSNYPIRVSYRDKNGEVQTYHSKPIDMPDLIAMQRVDEIRDGLVILDEWSLFCNSRRSGAQGNLIFGGIVQLIRKRGLSFYISSQDFHVLDRNIRWQCDITVQCFDLCFRYHNLQEGQVISQMVTDWSGVFTGKPLLSWGRSIDEYERNKATKTRMLLKAKLFWDTYQTGFEYDVLEVMSRRYNLQRNDYEVSTVGDNGGFDATLLTDYRAGLISAGVTRISSDDLRSGLADMGLEGDLRGHMGQKLKALGFQYRPGRAGNFYEIVEK